MTPVYLAGSSRELPRARAARAALLELGLVVAGGDWIEEVDTHGSVGLRLPQGVRETIAAAWVASIRGAGVVCALVPDDHVSVGLVHELGVAQRAVGGLGAGADVSSASAISRTDAWRRQISHSPIFRRSLAQRRVNGLPETK